MRGWSVTILLGMTRGKKLHESELWEQQSRERVLSPFQVWCPQTTILLCWCASLQCISQTNQNMLRHYSYIMLPTHGTNSQKHLDTPKCSKFKIRPQNVVALLGICPWLTAPPSGHLFVIFAAFTSVFCCTFDRLMYLIFKYVFEAYVKHIELHLCMKCAL